MDLFSSEAKQESNPVKKVSAMLLERRLKPPAVIMQNQGPDIVAPRMRENAPELTVKEISDITPMPVVEEISKPIAIIAVKPLEEERSKSARGRKSIKEMSMEADLPEVPEDEKLFSKQYYGIGEVATMFHVNASLLRYWETEFDVLKPKKNGKGDRFFRPEDIKNLQIIHHLLRQKKFTIQGAKDYLKNNRQSKEKFDMVKQLQQLKAFLLEMKAGL